MGSQQSSKSESCVDLGENVLEGEFQIFLNQNPSEEDYEWFQCKFLLSEKVLKCRFSGEAEHMIPIDSDFNLVNEQQEDLIFTINFKTENNAENTWKIKTNTLNDFINWTSLLKKLKRPLWCKKSHCEECKKSFGVVSRRHHCRECGASVCAKCSPVSTTLPHLGYSSLVRVCKTCGVALDDKRRGTISIETPNYSKKGTKKFLRFMCGPQK